MTNRIADLSLNKTARVAGFGLLIMAFLGIFANFFVFTDLIIPGDAAATANNIIASEGLFRVGIISFIIVLLCDVVVAWALYVVLKPVNKSLSLLAAWFRLVYSAIHGIALLNLIIALQLLSGHDYLNVFETDQLHGLALLFLSGHKYGFLIGLVFFGFHLLVLGYLVFKSGYFPRILGILLVAASLGYLIDSFANFLLPNYTNYETIFLLIAAVPSVIGEVSLCLWLLVKGVKQPS